MSSESSITKSDKSKSTGVSTAKTLVTWFKNLITFEEKVSTLNSLIEKLIDRQKTIDNNLFEVKGELKGYPQLLESKLELAVRELEQKYIERELKLELAFKELEQKYIERESDHAVRIALLEEKIKQHMEL